MMDNRKHNEHISYPNIAEYLVSLNSIQKQFSQFYLKMNWLPIKIAFSMLIRYISNLASITKRQINFPFILDLDNLEYNKFESTMGDKAEVAKFGKNLAVGSPLLPTDLIQKYQSNILAMMELTAPKSLYTIWNYITPARMMNLSAFLTQTKGTDELKSERANSSGSSEPGISDLKTLISLENSSLNKEVQTRNLIAFVPPQENYSSFFEMNKKSSVLKPLDTSKGLNISNLNSPVFLTQMLPSLKYLNQYGFDTLSRFSSSRVRFKEDETDKKQIVHLVENSSVLPNFSMSKDLGIIKTLSYLKGEIQDVEKQKIQIDNHISINRLGKIFLFSPAALNNSIENGNKTIFSKLLLSNDNVNQIFSNFLESGQEYNFGLSNFNPMIHSTRFLHHFVEPVRGESKRVHFAFRSTFNRLSTTKAVTANSLSLIENTQTQNWSANNLRLPYYIIKNYHKASQQVKNYSLVPLKQLVEFRWFNNIFKDSREQNLFSSNLVTPENYNARGQNYLKNLITQSKSFLQPGLNLTLFQNPYDAINTQLFIAKQFNTDSNELSSAIITEKIYNTQLSNMQPTNTANLRDRKANQVINNTFNVTVNTTLSETGDDMGDLADKLTEILRDEARRYGIKI